MMRRTMWVGMCVNAIIATVDPNKIRFEERKGAGKASINGQSLLPLETTVANGKTLVEIRTKLAADAIRKALATPSRPRRQPVGASST